MNAALLIYRKISIHAPSRERRLVCFLLAVNQYSISIHAPSRERLSASRKILPCLSISIHAPSRERLKRMIEFCWQHEISIHAPSRERRESRGESVNSVSDFNPRSLAGATGLAAGLKLIPPFQSTLPRGSDLAGVPSSCVIKHISIHAPSRERL